jgi:hypothetical protein
MVDGSRTADVIAGDVFFEIIEPEELEYTYRLKPAKNFGSSFNDKNIKFESSALVSTQPADSCDKILNARDIKGNIALVERG